MDLNDLLRKQGIDPDQVLVLRHRPPEPALNRVLPWLAAKRPEVFNAFQQTQGEKLEKAMTGAAYVASFIGHAPGKALFVGLYSIGKSKPLTREEYWEVEAHIEMKKKFGMKGGPEEGRLSVLWFDLVLTEFYASWKGKLVVAWPGLERSWWRWANRNIIEVLAVFESSALDSTMPPWYELTLSWEELNLLPTSWESKLRDWRGIYYIFDTSDGKGYVGSAYSEANLLGRWQNYAASGDGGNKLLKDRNPGNFVFTILQRVSPDMDKDDVTRVETSWKMRLHTKAPFGLNAN